MLIVNNERCWVVNPPLASGFVSEQIEHLSDSRRYWCVMSWVVVAYGSTKRQIRFVTVGDEEVVERGKWMLNFSSYAVVDDRKQWSWHRSVITMQPEKLLKIDTVDEKEISSWKTTSFMRERTFVIVIKRYCPLS